MKSRVYTAPIYATAIGMMFAASLAHAETIASVTGANNGLILGPANGNVVVDIQFTLSQEFDNVSLGAGIGDAFENGSLADFYLTTQVGAGTTIADQLASLQGYEIPSYNYDTVTTVFSGLDLQAGTYNFVLGGTAGYPVLGYTYPADANDITLGSGVSYDNLYTQFGNSYEPASSLSGGGNANLEFNFEITGDATAPEPATVSLMLASLMVAMVWRAKVSF